MSTAASVTTSVACAPIARRVRAYFAPVNRAAATPTLFDPAQQGRFDLDTPPAPWLDLGWITGFSRRSMTRVDPLRSGAPAAPVLQVRTELEATVGLAFESWGKLQCGLASGSQNMNLLAAGANTNMDGSGGPAAAPVPLVTSGGTLSTASALNVGGTAAAAFAPGDLIAVDVDFASQTGYIGSGVSAAYVPQTGTATSDINYIRRITWNVGLVAAVSGGVLQLAAPLLAGAPAAGMQISKLVGFCDREGASFFQEWSALFVMDGEQGDRMLFHYPRLQPLQGSAEAEHALAPPLQEVRLAAAFRALPVRDPNDGETVLCFRSYLPAPMRQI